MQQTRDVVVVAGLAVITLSFTHIDRGILVAAHIHDLGRVSGSVFIFLLFSAIVLGAQVREHTENGENT